MLVGTMTDGHSDGKGAKEEEVLVALLSVSSSESEIESDGAEVVVSVVVGTAELARRAEVGTHAYKLDSRTKEGKARQSISKRIDWTRLNCKRLIEDNSLASTCFSLRTFSTRSISSRRKSSTQSLRSRSTQSHITSPSSSIDTICSSITRVRSDSRSSIIIAAN